MFCFLFCFFFLWRVTEDRSLDESVQCRIKRRKSKKCWFWCWCSCSAVYTQCLFDSCFFVHFVYLLGRFSEVNIGYQPPFLQAYIIHTSFSVFTPCVIYCAMTFYYFLCYCIIFLHTYPYKHVHMFWFFFKLPHSFTHGFVIIWDESGITNECWISLISTGEKSLMFLQYVLTGFSGIVLASLYIKLFFFSVCCLLWELRFKSLTNVFVCWTVLDSSAPLSASARRGAITCHSSFLHRFLWDFGRKSSQVRGT